MKYYYSCRASHRKKYSVSICDTLAIATEIQKLVIADFSSSTPNDGHRKMKDRSIISEQQQQMAVVVVVVVKEPETHREGCGPY